MSSDIPRTEAVEGDVYGPEDVYILQGLEHIRQRPGMYIADTRSRGLHHLAYELVANSVDEALAGFCRHIHLCLHADGSLSISDDGRGIPVEAHLGRKRTTLEVMLTVVGATGKFRQEPYRMAGLHGLGLKVI